MRQEITEHYFLLVHRRARRLDAVVFSAFGAFGPHFYYLRPMPLSVPVLRVLLRTPDFLSGLPGSRAHLICLEVFL